MTGVQTCALPIYLAKLVYDDVHGLKKNGLSGIVEDCSQRSFFPTGLAFYVYAEALFDLDKSFETLVEEYFSAAFGKDWRLAYDYLSAISENTEFGFLAGEEVRDRHDPAKVPSFEKIIELADAFGATIDAQIEKDVRCQYVHWDLMRWQIKFAKIYAEGAIHLAKGESDEASKSYVKICNELALLVHLRPTVFDHRHMTIAAKRVLSPKKSYSQVLIEE